MFEKVRLLPEQQLLEKGHFWPPHIFFLFQYLRLMIVSVDHKVKSKDVCNKECSCLYGGSECQIMRYDLRKLKISEVERRTSPGTSTLYSEKIIRIDTYTISCANIDINFLIFLGGSLLDCIFSMTIVKNTNTKVEKVTFTESKRLANFHRL